MQKLRLEAIKMFGKIYCEPIKCILLLRLSNDILIVFFPYRMYKNKVLKMTNISCDFRLYTYKTYIK